jgi:hypothetical protein
MQNHLGMPPSMMDVNEYGQRAVQGKNGERGRHRGWSGAGGHPQFTAVICSRMTIAS